MKELASQAIFYHTNAALNAGAITAPQAIEQLERLRFRWRGDGLELKTLRKLASLYFGSGKWREGLKTLRVATQKFPRRRCGAAWRRTICAAPSSTCSSRAAPTR